MGLITVYQARTSHIVLTHSELSKDDVLNKDESQRALVLTTVCQARTSHIVLTHSVLSKDECTKQGRVTEGLGTNHMY